jgi:glycosyltransferase involved in cell wall biosynthesis
MRLSKKLKAKLIFNVSDLWPESAEKLGVVSNHQLLKLAYNLEAKCYNKSTLITGQTQGIIDDIKNRFPSKNVYWLPNGVDVNFYNPDRIEDTDFRQRNNFKSDDLLFFYGGILGHAQGLEIILKAAKLVEDKPSIQFILQGSGPEKDLLLELKKELNITNVHFFDPVPKAEMPAIVKAVDIALVPLKNLPLFQGAIPSKVFEALAMKKPLLLGVDGEARHHFIDNAKAGMFFIPENEEDLAKQILVMANNPEKLLEMGLNARNYVSTHFNRDKIASEFLEVLNENL